MSFLHQGANKIWYGTPASAALDLERAVAKYLDIPLNGEGHEEVRRLLLKKATMIPPNVLMAAGVPVCRAIQQPGEFIVTFSRSYHAGFSVGEYQSSCNSKLMA